MGLLPLKTCCCCLNLKTGSLVMGCLHAVGSLALTIYLMVLACIINPSMPCPYKGPTYGSDQGMGTLASIILIFFGTIFFVKFCFDVFFVYGVVKERACIVDTYFYINSIVLVLSILLFFLATDTSIETLSTEIFYTAINIYTILVTDAFYKQLKSREEVRRI